VQISVKNTEGKVVKKVKVLDEIFDVDMNSSLMHQVMVGHLANARQGTASTKTRSQVSGGGRKPHPQKVGGRARAGSIRAPNWKGGGVVFGPTPRKYNHHTPKKMRRLSMATALSDKVREDTLIVLDQLKLDVPGTKEMSRLLNNVGVNSSVLLVGDGADPLTLRAARNIPRLNMIPASLLNTLEILKHQKMLMTLDAVRKVEEIWGSKISTSKKTRVTESVNS